MLDAFRPALRVLQRASKAAGRGLGRDLGARFEAHPNGVVLALDAARLRLLVQPRGEGKAWARTASFSLAVQQGGEDALGAEALGLFVRLLERLDPGGLALGSTLPTGQAAPTRTRQEDARRKALAERSRLALRDELAQAELVAHQAVVHEDLYPHVGALGEPITQEQLFEGWGESLARRSRGEGADKLGLYVHVPFCAVACSFCYCGKTDDFDRARFERWFAALLNEVEDFGPLFGAHRFTSVYFGGGTPSLLPAPWMRRMFELLWTHFEVPPGTQVIYEGNPDSLSEDKIRVLAEEGRVTRLTVGVQTLDDEVQARVRRHNKPEHVVEAIRAARASAIPHVNTDLMAGLPGQTVQSFLNDLQFLLSLEPDSIHLNAFRPLPRTRVARQGRDEQADADWRARRDEMMARGRELLRVHGHAVAEDGRMRRTHDASNLQEYDLRTQNSSLLGLGFPALSHAFGSWFYCPDRSEGFDPALWRDIDGGRRWLGVSAGGQEEAHKYMVTNLVTGWERSEFRALFGRSAEEVAGEQLQKLYDLDVLDLDQRRVVSRSGGPADTLTHRVLLYSPELAERAREVWGSPSSSSVDHGAALRSLLEGSAR